MQKNLITIFAYLLLLSATAQQKQDIVTYIERYKQAAIDEMVRSKVPASITIAQGILESSAGTSVLSRNSNNHFGIKCKDEWTGSKYYHDDDRPQECFRVYSNVRESYADHSDFLLTRPRYAPLFELPLTSYKYWAYGLKEAGYATNPKYASMLIGYIEDYNLFELDKQGVAMIEGRDKIMKQPEVAEQIVAKAETKIVVTDVKNKERHQQIITAAKSSEASRQEFVVNGIRAVKAEANEDPFKIAFEYNIDFSFIMSYNDMNTGDRFKAGEFVFLQPKKSRGADAIYTVSAGESMHDVSQKTGVKMRDLYAKNVMRMNEQAYPGEPIYLQEKKTAPPRVMSYAEFLSAQNKNTATGQNKLPNNASVSNKNDVPNLPRGNIMLNASEYQVQQSDTLYSIAKKFGTSIEELKTINNLNGTDVRAGQTLVVSK